MAMTLRKVKTSIFIQIHQKSRTWKVFNGSGNRRSSAPHPVAAMEHFAFYPFGGQAGFIS
jgi:hypothetical protein